MLVSNIICLPILQKVKLISQRIIMNKLEFKNIVRLDLGKMKIILRREMDLLINILVCNHRIKCRKVQKDHNHVRKYRNISIKLAL